MEESWAVSANEALNISLVRAKDQSSNELVTTASFGPQFTYPIFGEDEQVFGYKGLRMDLRFKEDSLESHFRHTFEKELPAAGDVKPDDVQKLMKPWLAEEAFRPSSAFEQTIAKDNAQYRPPGQLLESYTSRGRCFEIWKSDLSDPVVRALLGRMQIFVSLFIEGGTPLELNDSEWTLSRWRVYLLYEKQTTATASYSFVGYATSYRFIVYTPESRTTPTDFTFPPTTIVHPDSLPCRTRISQFVILPCHHSHGHGSRLYRAIMQECLTSPTCVEMTVEDPNEAFDDLRDYCDYANLTLNGTFAKLQLNVDLDPQLSANRRGVRVPTTQLLDRKLLEALRKKNKMSPRQFARLVELYLFSRIPKHTRQAGTARLTQRARSSNRDDRTFYYWRLLVKQRVYKQNKDVLMQLDRMDRAEKLEQTVADLISDYERLLLGIDKWTAAEQASITQSTATNRMKRKIVDDADEDGEDGGQNDDGRPRKRS